LGKSELRIRWCFMPALLGQQKTQNFTYPQISIAFLRKVPLMHCQSYRLSVLGSARLKLIATAILNCSCYPVSAVTMARKIEVEFKSNSIASVISEVVCLNKESTILNKNIFEILQPADIPVFLFCLHILSNAENNSSVIYCCLRIQCVCWWGYLLQDLIGKSLFNYILPENISIVKEALEMAAKLAGKPVFGKPYHFFINNGDSILMESEWIVLLHPWSSKVDAVLAKHRVLISPKNTDIFTEKIGNQAIDEEKISEAQNFLMDVFSQVRVKSDRLSNCCTSNNDEQKSSYSSSPPEEPRNVINNSPVGESLHQENLIESLVEQVAVSEGMFSYKGYHGSQNFKSSCKAESLSDSPPDSSGSCPSYNQINLLENVNRYFKSQTDPIILHEETVRECHGFTNCVEPSGDQLSLFLEKPQLKLANIPSYNKAFLPLTPENLRFFNEEKKLQLKALWKDRFASGIAVTSLQSLKRKTDDNIDEAGNIGYNLDSFCKLGRYYMQRPASTPVMSKANLSQCDPVNANMASSVSQIVMNGNDSYSNYYRSLGPTPAPPAGQNVLITSTPLPQFNVNMEDFYSANISGLLNPGAVRLPNDALRIWQANVNSNNDIKDNDRINRNPVEHFTAPVKSEASYAYRSVIQHYPIKSTTKQAFNVELGIVQQNCTSSSPVASYLTLVDLGIEILSKVIDEKQCVIEIFYMHAVQQVFTSKFCMENCLNNRSENCEDILLPNKTMPNLIQSTLC
ncbi:Period circadian protein, partial [Trichinella nelsoni]